MHFVNSNDFKQDLNLISPREKKKPCTLYLLFFEKKNILLNWINDKPQTIMF